MSATLPDLFAHAAHLGENYDTKWLDELVRREMDSLLAREKWDANNSGCHLVDIGEFLVRAVGLLSQLADSLTKGRHIAAITKERIEVMKIDNDLSELNPLYDLSENISTTNFLPG